MKDDKIRKVEIKIEKMLQKLEKQVNIKIDDIILARFGNGNMVIAILPKKENKKNEWPTGY